MTDLLNVKGEGAEARRLSFLALDIEQIGHVYEGLLDHTCKRAKEPTVSLTGAKYDEPEIELPELEDKLAKGQDDLVKFLKKQTSRSPGALKKALDAEPDGEHVRGLRTACGNNDALLKRLLPFAGLIRNDTFGMPCVILPGSAYVTAGEERRATGTHYTPRSLTEPIVQYTLEPLVYEGPAEGKDKDQWKLRSAAELLDLKVCDMACGSGAFLVQACRYLSERLCEAWEAAEAEHPGLPGITPEGQVSEGRPGEQLVPNDTDERMAYARRIVAQRCLYGVDKNPLAVEMAKLSLWLLTVAKYKPFTFLNHAIRCGDSLVGIQNINQLKTFSIDCSGRQYVFGEIPLDELVDAAIGLRFRIESMLSTSVEDVHAQASLLSKCEERMVQLRSAADMLVSAEMAPARNENERQEHRDHAAIQTGFYLKNGNASEFRSAACSALDGNRLLHWPLEFPEVVCKRAGFDAFVGNPPFMGGSVAKKALGDHYKKYVARMLGRCHGNSDIAAWFYRKAARLLNPRGGFGLLGSDSIGEGDTRDSGLLALIQDGWTIYHSRSSFAWPGSAQVRASMTVASQRDFQGPRTLDSRIVPYVSSRLDSIEAEAPPPVLARRGPDFIMGTKVYGEGFVLDENDLRTLLAEDSRSEEVVKRYQTGSDLNATTDQTGTRWVIDFDDMSEQNAASYSWAFRRVLQLVKPERETRTTGKASREWWKYERPRRELYDRIGDKEAILAKAATSSTFAFAWVSTGAVYANTLFLAPDASDSDFAIVSCSLYEQWAVLFCSTLKGDMRFAPSDMYENFPVPNDSGVLQNIGAKYSSFRSVLMSKMQEGLTKTYNRLHDPSESSADIQELRELHVEMDRAVAAAYDWHDIDLGHGFHETQRGTRFTISDQARREVLTRLLKLNQQRYAEEVAKGLHEKKKRTTGSSRRHSAKKKESAAVRHTGKLIED